MIIGKQNRMLERLIDRFDKKIDGGKGRMKVLSLFDGISCGMVALERTGIPVDAY